MDSDRYFGIGRVLGGISAFITFWVTWIGCMAHYGFLFGFGLGWLPASILAGIVGFGVTLLWGPALLVVALGVFALMSQQHSSSASASSYDMSTPAADAAAAAADNPNNSAATAADAAADAAATAAASGSTYPVYSGYGGYEASRGSGDCTQDCSGHEAGYAWAESRGIDDGDDCGGNSDSFIEGCRAYVKDNGGENADDE